MASAVTLPGVKGAYAVGVMWRHEDAVPSRRTLRTRSEQLEARWGVVHRTRKGYIQVGFCPPIRGVNSCKTVKPLAALVADCHPQPWFGFYRLAEDLYWYIAVRDGQEVLPDGDRIGSFDELRSVHEKHLKYGDWTEVRGNGEDLAKIVKNARRAKSFVDVHAGPQRAIAITLGAIASAAALGVTYRVHHEHELAIERAAAAARQRAQLATLAAQQAAHQIKPWTRQPLPSSVIRACAAAWHDQSIVAAGWQLSSWKCSAHAILLPTAIKIDARWSRAGGSAADAPGPVDQDGEHANTSREVPFAFTAQQATHTRVDSSDRTAWALAQKNAYQLKIDDSLIGAALPGTFASAAEMSLPWNTDSANFALPMAPWLNSPTDFDSVAGLRVTSIELDDAQVWHVKGPIYTSRELQPAASTKGA